jgi:hypothetical protein
VSEQQFPHVHTFRDRHGRLRRYFRRRGEKAIPLPGDPGSEEFVAAYAEAQDPKPVSYVYFALLGSGRGIKVKIGVARDPRRRLLGMRAAMPGEARIYYVTPGSNDLEKQLHALFSGDHIHGEWFVFSRSIKEWIAADEVATGRLSSREQEGNKNAQTGGPPSGKP